GTGDRVRRLAGGELAFLGRLDHQVKVRGFRIEPGEVEAALASHPGVREAAVIAREDLPGDRCLVAYWVPEPGPEPAVAELRSHLRRRLPDAMVPSRFVALPALPRPAHEEGPESGGALRTPVEEAVAAIWSAVLGSPVRDGEASFFELGGHSLLAVQAQARVRGQLGVDLPLRTLFEAPTVAAFAHRVEEALYGAAGLERPPLVAAAAGRDLPLSVAQQRLWFLDQLEPGSAAYNLPAAVGLSGRLSPAALVAALGQVVARHAMLRTRFASVAGRPVQRVAPAREGVPFPLPLADLSGLPGEHAAAEMRRLSASEGELPFDLESGPLLRALLLCRSVDEHVLLLTLHHIAADGGSIRVLAAEVAALYEAALAGAASPLPPLPLQYGDYAVWQRDWLRGPVLETQLAFWRKRLAGAPAALDLPTDRPRPAVTGAGGSRSGLHPVLFEPGLAAPLAALARSEGATLFMALLAAWKILLHRSSGEVDLAVGVPVSNRHETALEGLIGLFINTVVLRTSLEGGPAFRELLGRIREEALAAYTHQDLPFERLVEELAPERSLARAPFFQVMFDVRDATLDRVGLPGLDLALVPAESSRSKFDLILSLERSGDALGGVLEYRLDLFEPETAARLVRQIATLLAAAVRDPDTGIGVLPLLSPAERQEILRVWNDTGTPYPPASLEELFEEQAERSPEAPAVSFGGRTLTYAALDAAANRLARRLHAWGVGPDVRVAVCAERGCELIVAFLAVLKAGGAYVPLDPEYPRERLALMLADSRAVLALAGEPWVSTLAETGVPVVRLGAEGGEGPEGDARPARPWGSWPERLAYVMYTSGSTGRPKGVGVTHRNVVRLVRNTDYVSFEPADRVAQVSNSAFDAATFEIWGALLNGAGLVGIERQASLAPAELARHLAEERVTTLFLTTALFNQIAREAPRAFAGLRHLLFGGEAVDPRWVREALSQGAPERLLHVYGPTETTTFATWQRVPEVPAAAVDVPIGRPIANTRAYILEAHLEPAPVRGAGDLYIGGDGVARGYLDRPDLTAERFLPDPWSPQPGARMYWTGDRARFRADGAIEFLGRLDHQVKIRGFRIELAEIEAVLLEQPGVHEAVVVAREERPGDKRLAAYVTGAGLEAAALRQSLRSRLPAYMVPAAITLLPALPLTPNGKVDRRALP
ncbi:MAG TPA: amino acid adenylation domain-containing protein, partial [Thermoanaerobaculia bacterium]